MCFVVQSAVALLQSGCRPLVSAAQKCVWLDLPARNNNHKTKKGQFIPPPPRLIYRSNDINSERIREVNVHLKGIQHLKPICDGT